MIENTLFTEKYRPQDLSELIVPQRIRTLLSKGAEMNLLLYGTPGIGKTTTAKAVAHTFGMNYLYINGSSETGIDVIREKIINFACQQQLGMSFMDGENSVKLVILDEMDMMSAQAYSALRATMEQYHSVLRIIGTCNYIEKIPDPIKSRFQLIDYNFSESESVEVKKQYVRRVYDICKKEGIETTPQACLKLVEAQFPDFRSIIAFLQQHKLSGNTDLKEDDVKTFNTADEDLYNICLAKPDPVENYKFVLSNYSSTVDDALISLGREFIEYIISRKVEYIGYLPQIVITTAKYLDQVKNAKDPIICLLACVYEIQRVVNS